ncbi:13775_t:CDS:2, partial [Acaulospora colombiana]
ALTQLQTTSTGGNGSGGWLARLGWGLGEASVEVLEPTPSHVYEARIAFFGRAIPEDGLTGWLVPLDSLVGECPSSYREATASGAISSPSPSISGLPPPFTVLEPAADT